VQRILHFNTQFASLGGVEAVLRAHHERDAGTGIDPRFVAFWEPASPGWARCRFLGFERATRVRAARRRIAEAVAGFNPALSVHHTLWGQPYWGDLDPAPRRVLFLHSDVPGLSGKLAARMPGMDAVLAVSDTLLERAREAAPTWESGRLFRIHYPVFGPDSPPRGADGPVGRAIVLGYAGRLSREQKRVERFVELAARLDARGIRWRLEFLGDGDERSALEAALPDRSRVTFHGRRSGEDYWRIVGGWDAIGFTSDYEGTPIALLEAMSRGVVPVHPRLGSGGDGYAARVDEGLVYSVGDMDGMAGAIGMLASWTGPRWDEARARARALMEPHEGRQYLRTFAAAVEAVVAMPARNKRPGRRWGFPADRLSFARWEWLAGLRRGAK
jgi:glycosyltransferase involved in cell wall biosynthesis